MFHCSLRSGHNRRESHKRCIERWRSINHAVSSSIRIIIQQTNQRKATRRMERVKRRQGGTDSAVSLHNELHKFWRACLIITLPDWRRVWVRASCCLLVSCLCELEPLDSESAYPSIAFHLCTMCKSITMLSLPPSPRLKNNANTIRTSEKRLSKLRKHWAREWWCSYHECHCDSATKMLSQETSNIIIRL